VRLSFLPFLKPNHHHLLLKVILLSNTQFGGRPTTCGLKKQVPVRLLYYLNHLLVYICFFGFINSSHATLTGFAFSPTHLSEANLRHTKFVLNTVRIHVSNVKKVNKNQRNIVHAGELLIPTRASKGHDMTT
jgi:hypothetical protein